LSKLHKGIVDYPGVRPVVDAEALKYVMVEMAVEAEIDCFLHCWGVDAVMDGSKVCGAVLESKSGRQAILSKVVVDATGDGDLFAAAGAAYEQIQFGIGLVSRIGNLPHPLPKPPEGSKPPRGLGGHTPIEGVNWVNMTGPRADALDVSELSQLELNHRRQIWRQVERLRNTPGYENVYLMETAPQLGVRMSRLLDGVKQLTYEDAEAGTTYPDVIGYSGDWINRDFEWQIPYGALVPRKVDNILAAGRCISGERKMADLLRVIPPCFVTGHAAGVAAAVCVQDGCLVRDVEVAKVRNILKEQDAYLG
ncbi:MAG: FAD-dependent oxidoreductase, partial [Thermoguttaceae bacterium]|nr:FAD-dependent oxidoreductase [Thermoguttaceae bacterium]